MSKVKQPKPKTTLHAFVSAILRARRTLRKQPFALNSIEQRCVLVRWLNQRKPFDCFVETGTFVGSSTRFFAQLANQRPVYTAEINPVHAYYAKKQLKRFSNIIFKQANSPELLRELDASCTPSATFVYLDAHWLQYLPILEELEICLQWQDAIVMIDDFRVPHDARFHYDDYGAEGVLELDYLRAVLQKHGVKQVYFPSSYRDYPFHPSLNQPNHSQGFVLLATNPKAHGMLKKAPLLVEHVV